MNEVRRDRGIATLLALVTFFVYSLTMCRTIYTGDDGDFLTAMTTLGISHPTGYPLFTLLGHFFLRLTAPLIDEPATRINVMTALFGAAAVGMFYRFLAVTLPSRIASAMVALLLAFAPTLWQQSLSCEVYSLTCLFLASALYLAVQRRWAPLAVVYGLALTNNLTMALFFPGFLLYLLGNRPTLFREGKLLLTLTGLFLLPLTLYAYLPLSARFAHSPVNWSDPQTWPRFLTHVGGAQYRPLMFSKPLLTWPDRLVSYGRDFLCPELGWLLLGFAALGLGVLWRRTTRPLLLLTLWIFVVDVVYATNYDIADIYVYFLPSYVMVAFWSAAGITAVGRTVFERAWRVAKASIAVRTRQTQLIGVVALAIPLVQMSLHFAETTKAGNFLEADYAANILRSAPPNAVIITTSSTTFTLWYRKWVLGDRADVVILNPDLFLGTLGAGENWYPDHIRAQWPDFLLPYGRSLRQISDGTYFHDLLTDTLRRGRPVLFLSDTRSDHMALGNLPSKNALIAPFVRVPWGIVDRLYLPGTQPSDAEIVAANERLWPKFSLRGFSTGWLFNDPLQRNMSLRYFFASKAVGQLAERTGHVQTARTHYERANFLFSDPEVVAGLKRLSGAHGQSGL